MSFVKSLQSETVNSKLRHEQLVERCQELENENEDITKKFIEIQMMRAKNNEIVTQLKKEAITEKIKCDRDISELKFLDCAIKQLSELQHETDWSYTSSVTKEKYLKEYAQFKEDMIKCLERELCDVKLKIAEDDELVKELKQTKLELEVDKKLIQALTPDTVASLQKDLVDSKCRMSQIDAKFDHTKREIAEIKINWEHCLKDHKENLNRGKEFDVYVHGLWNHITNNENRNALTELKGDLDSEELEIKQLKKEILTLEMHIDDITTKNELNELRILKNEMELDNYKGSSIIMMSQRNQLCERYAKLAEQKKEVLENINKSIEDKDKVLLDLSNKLMNLETKKSPDTNMTNENNKIVDDLEKTIANLEEKIKLLREGDERTVED